MLYFNSKCHFSIAIFGRKNVGKASFLQFFLDRHDIMISDIFENEDYKKITYEQGSIGIIELYQFQALPDMAGNVEELKYELASLLNRMDFIMYIVGSIKDISEFDKRFIQMLDELQAKVICVFNKRAREEVSTVQLYMQQGNLGVGTYLCNCANRADVIAVNEVVKKHITNEYDFFCAVQFLKNGCKAVIFLMPLNLAGHTKNMAARHYELISAVSENNGIAICLDKEQLSQFLQQSSFRPDVMVTKDKILYNVKDLQPYLT